MSLVELKQEFKKLKSIQDVLEKDKKTMIEMIKTLNERCEHQKNQQPESFEPTSSNVQTKLEQLAQENQTLKDSNIVIADQITGKKAQLEDYRHYHKSIIKLLGEGPDLNHLNHRQIVDKAVSSYKSKIGLDNNSEQAKLVLKLKEDIELLNELNKETLAKDSAIKKFFDDKDKTFNQMNTYDSEDKHGPSFVRALNIDFDQ